MVQRRRLQGGHAGLHLCAGHVHQGHAVVVALGHPGLHGLQRGLADVEFAVPHLLLSVERPFFVGIGANDGKVKATVIDGPPNYIFEWSNGSVQGPTSLTTSTISGLPAGIYTVTVTDSNGCTVSSEAQVEEGMIFTILPLPDLAKLIAMAAATPFCSVSCSCAFSRSKASRTLRKSAARSIIRRKTSRTADRLFWSASVSLA